MVVSLRVGCLGVMVWSSVSVRECHPRTRQRLQRSALDFQIAEPSPHQGGGRPGCDEEAPLIRRAEEVRAIPVERIEEHAETGQLWVTRISWSALAHDAEQPDGAFQDARLDVDGLGKSAGEVGAFEEASHRLRCQVDAGPSEADQVGCSAALGDNRRKRLPSMSAAKKLRAVDSRDLEPDGRGTRR